jgi:Phospholipase B
MIQSQEGWHIITISGKPFERGKMYGQLVADQMLEIKRIISFQCKHDYKIDWDTLVVQCKRHFFEKIKVDFPEFFLEMSGFAQGLQDKKVDFSLDEVVMWNNYITLTEYFLQNKKQKERCSAFMAVGDYTRDGKIVMGHNTFSNYLDGQLFNYILDITPEKGYRIVMQTCAGWIWSGSDFFVTSKGIMGTETSIGDFKAYQHNYPICCRIRKAMQYGKSLDDYATILLEGNSGDYANSWLLGDIHTNKIMRIELGLKYHNIETLTNGYFIGFNEAYDKRIQTKECKKSEFYNIKHSRGARRIILQELMEFYKGRLDTTIAKKIIANHYDVYLKKVQKTTRTICAHTMKRKTSFKNMYGAVDGKVCDSSLAKQMSFLMRWGNSCGTPFSSSNKYLYDRPRKKWIKK